ncbi:MAG: glutathione S-transferase family protein [Saccharospirillaceae bacterium]|nr:glutathione S-transferase family protein [Pseudomonadales bacterium]NRB79669.1 glutathione S-transferase family protein [Saccharospirillaceae bacterium]
MFTLYGWNTPNSLKVLIMLFELDVKFSSKAVPLDGSQFNAEFSQINRNQKTPVLAFDNHYLAESGAILLYLSQRFNLFNQNPEVMQWLMWQMSAQGPVTGNLIYFNYKAENKETLAIKRFNDEFNRQLILIESHLKNQSYLAVNYSIADMALFSWYHKLEQFGIKPEKYPNIFAWIKRVSKRPAIIKALEFEFSKTSQRDIKNEQ